uniref:Uncharacterized protein n=1 Tax=Globodera pallida TaxID=36090 RepID=A0A183CEC3_GLOPA
MFYGTIKERCQHGKDQLEKACHLGAFGPMTNSIPQNAPLYPGQQTFFPPCAKTAREQKKSHSLFDPPPPPPPRPLSTQIIIINYHFVSRLCILFSYHDSFALEVITTGIWLDHLSKLESRTGIVNGLSGLMLLGSVLVGVCFILTSVIICHYWASNSAKYQAVGRMAKRMRSLRRRTSKPSSGTERVGRDVVASSRMGHYSGGRHSGGGGAAGAGGVGQCSTHYQMECQSGGSGGEQQHHHHHHLQQQQKQQQLVSPPPLPHASSQHYHRSPTPYEIV